MRILLGVLAFVLLAAPLEAQRNCRRGIPCGNSCISASKTCRIGSPPPASTSAPQPLVSRSASRNAEGARFVASTRGRTYYLTSCSAAARLAPANRIYFRTVEEAEGAGLRRSSSRGC